MATDIAVRQANPFNGAARVERPAGGDAGGALARTDQARAIAEVQAALVIARQNPRDERASMDRILIACQRPGLANAAVYHYSRGGSDISGPSIRLAEAIAQSWGNLQFGIRELERILFDFFAEQLVAMREKKVKAVSFRLGADGKIVCEPAAK